MEKKLIEEKTSPAISIQNLTVSYHQTPVLRGVSLEIPRKKITCIIGPNGAGKSTLVKSILGLLPLNSGEIKILGASALVRKGQISYLPQKNQIDWDFPVTVQDVVMMGCYPSLGMFGWSTKKHDKMVQEALEQVEMLDFATRHIRLLSGGQQQRVFIARALVQKAEILLMDEPFVGVDSVTQETILHLMDVLKEEGKTIVLINHDLNLLNRFDHLIMLNQQLIASGPVDEIYNEKTRQLTYGGKISLIDKAEQSLESRFV